MVGRNYFWNFESSMALLDDQNIALFFGKTDKGVYQMQETLNAALEILQKAFEDWIKSISIEEKNISYFSDKDKEQIEKVKLGEGITTFSQSTVGEFEIGDFCILVSNSLVDIDAGKGDCTHIDCGRIKLKDAKVPT